MSGLRTPPHLATLIALTALSVGTLNMFLPSLANIAIDYQAEYSIVSLSIGGYLAVTAVVTLIAGPLSDKVGRRPVILGALAIFFAASVGCALATDVMTFLAFRMLQAGMAVGQALSLAIVRDTHKPDEAAGTIGYISMAMALGPMLGPVAGGFLDAAFGWRATFWLYSAAGLILLVTCWRDLGETRVGPSQERRETPFLLLKEPLFWAYALCSVFSVGAFFIFITGAPLVALSTFDVGAGGLGFYIGSITAGFMVGSFLTGRLATRVPGWALMLSGRLLAFVSLAIGLGAILLGYVTPLTFFGGAVLAGLGNGLTMPSSNARLMSVLPGLVGSAAGWSAALTVSSGAVLTTVTGYLVPAEDGAAVLLALMLISATLALLALFWALWLERRTRVPG